MIAVIEIFLLDGILLIVSKGVVVGTSALGVFLSYGTLRTLKNFFNLGGIDTRKNDLQIGHEAEKTIAEAAAANRRRMSSKEIARRQPYFREANRNRRRHEFALLKQPVPTQARRID